MDDLSGATRFMSAFNEIENHFRLTYPNGDEQIPFTKMAKDYAERHHIRFDLPALHAFANLRNTLVHSNYYGGKPIAEPVPDIVEAIETLRDAILNPPKVLAVLQNRTVASFRADDPIRSVLEEVRAHDYSQFPVTDDHDYHGLLPTNCIARWLAHRLAADEIVESEPVSAALAFAEPRDRAVHLPRTTTVAHAIKTLSPPADAGYPPAALIITQNGRRHETPLSIVVADDLPTLVAALSTGP